MKKFTVVLIVALLFTEAVFLYLKPSEVGFDFRMRYNEVKCVLSGTDPLFVWNGTVSSPIYTPFDWKHLYRDEGLNLVHSYPPWSYTYFMPLTLFLRGVATMVFFGLEMLCMFVLFVASFHWGFARKGRFWEGFLCLCLVVVTSMFQPVMDCLSLLNYGILIAGALLGMIACLNRGRDILAGFCWAYMMVKPQIALIYAIPLLMCGKWRTMMTAFVTCLFASIPPAVLCGRSPLSMIFSIFEYSQGYERDVMQMMPLLPTCVMERLLPILTMRDVMIINALFGVAGCGMATWFVRRQKDWLFRLLPTVFFSVLWMVSRTHDRSVYIFLYLGGTISLLKLLDKYKKWILARLVDHAYISDKRP